MTSSVRSVERMMLLVDQTHAERKVSPAEVAGEYTRVNEIANQLKVMQDMFQDVARYGFSQEWRHSFFGAFIKSGVALALLQSRMTDEDQRQTRTREGKEFLKDLRSSPKALSTAEELHPVESSIVNHMPIQSAFAYVLLDKYIPQQEEALFALGRDLNLCGFAQNLFSPLLDIIKSFDSSPLAYNLGSYLAQTDGVANFKYGYELAITHYNAELQRADTDLIVVADAKAYITSMKNTINANATLTQAQKSELNGYLDEYTTTLTTINSQLLTLSNYLKNMNIREGDGYTSSYNVQSRDASKSYSVVELQGIENQVVDGVMDITTAEASGGELNFFTNYLAEVQNFGELAQTHQLMLEMQLCAMSQQWNLVAASLKLMHNTYRTLATGF